MTSGYTPRLRDSQDPNGAFFAQITTMNKAVRTALLDLSRARPTDAHVQAFVHSANAGRTALWEDWKRAVPHGLQDAVRSVRDPHHGPDLHQAGTTGTRSFKRAYQSFATSLRDQIARLEAAQRGDPVISDCTRKIVDHLGRVDAVVGGE